MSRMSLGNNQVENTVSKRALRKQARKSRRAEVKNTLVSSYVGGMASNATVLGFSFTTIPFAKKLPSFSNSLTPSENETVINGFNKAFNWLGLPKKGITIERIAEDAVLEDRNGMKGVIDKVVKSEKAKQILKENIDPIEAIKSGKNAAFEMINNTIMLPEKKGQLLSFHEMGHALNKVNGKLPALLQKVRNPIGRAGMLLASLILFTKKHEIKENPTTRKEKTQNAVGKAVNWTRKAAPWLVALSRVPTILEEGLASIKAQKIANKVLSPDLAKKVAKTNMCGFATYLLSAVALGIATKVGLSVKDHLYEKMSAKRQAKENQNVAG